MARFYFTYGISGHPFMGGWTVVFADDIDAACLAFRAYHPDKIEGVLNCAFVYDNEQFEKTEMPQKGNFGYRCREVITFLRKVVKNKMEVYTT